MKASMNIQHFDRNGEDGGKLAVTFPEVGKNARATMVLTNWKGARIVELDGGELTLLHAVLSADRTDARKHGAHLKMAADDITFSVTFTNRGEPYRDGYDINLDTGDWEGFPIFLESGDARDLATMIDKIMKQAA